MRVLGVDPGLAATGLVSVEGGKVLFRGTIKTPSSDPDVQRCSFIAGKVLETIDLVLPDRIVVEGYEYQGPRTEGPNAIRMSMLVGWLLGVCESTAPTVMVTRNQWGRALGAMSDAQLAARLERLSGLRPRNAHERDAAAIAMFGGVQ